MTQGQALAILKTGANIFLTGEPGSGKTHTVNEFVGWLRAAGIEPAITAATGIAATHVGGLTLHSWSGIGVSDTLSRAEVDRIAGKEHVARRIQKAKVLIIDEVSMLGARTFELADRVCREVRRDTRPFGGITVVLVGDFFQLPPVSRGERMPFAYESATWRELNLVICYLTEQYRQDDPAFLSALSAIRSNAVETFHYELLMARTVFTDGPADAPKLFSHNADVDRLNAVELAKLPGRAKTFIMNTSGREPLVEGLKRGCLSPEVLELKEDAAVMFTKNSPTGAFVNGTLGRVIGWSADGLPVIEIHSAAGGTRAGRTVVAEPMEWQVAEDGKVRASITQVPLRLAYAMTVHKSQGMSMDAAVMDLSRAFEYGQGYVALSRVRSLAGVHLLGLNARALEVHPDVLAHDAGLRAASEAADEAFGAMPEAELTGLHRQFIKAMGGAWPRESASHGSAKASAGIPGRLAATLQAVRDERTLANAAKARGLASSTVVKHLEELAALGTLMRDDFMHLLPDEIALGEIREALASIRGPKLAPVWSALGGRYSFETIRLTRLARE
ncbi:MAG TPA: AAA family ATPase [Candidatus Paceibacterota bacterium]|nr:AAA family ATPase [Candidatus Paceibacterota bacterium]